MQRLNKDVSSVDLEEQVFFSFDFTCAFVVLLDGLIFWQMTFKSTCVFPLGSCVVLKGKKKTSEMIEKCTYSYLQEKKSQEELCVVSLQQAKLILVEVPDSSCWYKHRFWKGICSFCLLSEAINLSKFSLRISCAWTFRVSQVPVTFRDIKGTECYFSRMYFLVLSLPRCWRQEIDVLLQQKYSCWN